MNEAFIYRYLIFAYFGGAAITFAILVSLPAPYGRYYQGNWGPSLPNRIGWLIMESPALWVFAWVFFQGRDALTLPALGMLGVWFIHYINRAIIYPIRLRTRTRRIPLLVCGLAFLFNSFNAYISARWISHLGTYSPDWLKSPHFLIGVAIFAGGMYLNVKSDNLLLALRARKKSGYGIPYSGGFNAVSCPNYLGEIIEWVGWAVLTWSTAGAAFAVYTMANLIPRAINHHHWYRSKFTDYPSERKVIIPGIF